MMFNHYFFFRIINDYLMKGPGYIAPSEQQYREFKTPDKALFRDVNTSTLLPNVSVDIIQAHSNAHGFQDLEQVFKDYREQNLHVLRSCKDELGVVYIFGQCLASMRSKVYNLDIVLNDNGTIKNSQCDCVAGAGSKTFCRHRAMAMVGLADHTSGNGVTTMMTSTQESCRWNHNKKPYKGSPVKASGLEVGLKVKPYYNNSSNRMGGQGSSTIRDKEYCYKSQRRNILAGIARREIGAQKRPMTQLVRPASIRAYDNDHTYAKLKPAMLFLTKSRLVNLDFEEVMVSFFFNLIIKEYCCMIFKIVIIIKVTNFNVFGLFIFKVFNSIISLLISHIK